MALTKIDDRGVTYPLDLLDNEQIRFGTGNDLYLYHNGTDSFIKNITGDLKIFLTGGTEEAALFKRDGAVELFYDGSKKIETYAGGCQMGGDLSFSDSQVANFGTGSDLKVFHDGSNSYIRDTTAGHLRLENDNIRLRNGASNETMLTGTVNDSVALWFDNSQKLKTTANGVSVENGCITTFGANTTNEASCIKVGYEGSSKGQIRVYGADASTTGSLEFKVCEGDGTDDHTMLFDSTGGLSIGHTGPITSYSSNSNKITIHKADGNGGVLELGGNTNADAYNAGQILFTNDNNANDTAWQSNSKLVGLIRAETITTDSNAGDDSGADLAFYTKAEAEAGSLKMMIHGEGYVTKPKQPCCMYTGLSNSHTSNATDSTETLVFATVKRNEGSHYNGSNGRFTAPVAGTYFVGVNLLIDDDASTASRSADLQKNGSGYTTITYDRNGGQYTGMSGTGIIELAVGDYISIRATAGVHIGNETGFVVYLLG